MPYMVLVTTENSLGKSKRELHSAQSVSSTLATYRYFHFFIIKLACSKLFVQETVITSNTSASWVSLLNAAHLGFTRATTTFHD